MLHVITSSFFLHVVYISQYSSIAISDFFTIRIFYLDFETSHQEKGHFSKSLVYTLFL